MSITYRLAKNDRFVRAKEFYYRLGISKAQFYKWVSNGILPEPIKLSQRSSVWPLSKVNDVLAKIASGEFDPKSPNLNTSA